MCPFSDVYGIVAPFRSTLGIVSTSFPLSASLSAGTAAADFFGALLAVFFPVAFWVMTSPCFDERACVASGAGRVCRSARRSSSPGARGVRRSRRVRRARRTGAAEAPELPPPVGGESRRCRRSGAGDGPASVPQARRLSRGLEVRDLARLDRHPARPDSPPDAEALGDDDPARDARDLRGGRDLPRGPRRRGRPPRLPLRGVRARRVLLR